MQCKDVCVISQVSILVLRVAPIRPGLRQENQTEQVKCLHRYLHQASPSRLGWNQDFVLSDGMAVQGSLKTTMQPHPHSRQSPPWGKEDCIQETLREIYRLWCCLLFAATSNPGIAGWIAFFNLWLIMWVICQRGLISTLVHCLFFHRNGTQQEFHMKLREGGFIKPSTLER